jgi:hypothetical protein
MLDAYSWGPSAARGPVPSPCPRVGPGGNIFSVHAVSVVFTEVTVELCSSPDCGVRGCSGLTAGGHNVTCTWSLECAA